MQQRDLRRWAAFAVLAPLQIFWAVTRSFDIIDETWFLQVAKRTLDGETLYRDVYFNTTPLSLYVTAGLAAVAGVQLLTVKLVVAFSVVASLLLAWKIIDRSVPSHRGVPLLLIALVLVYGNYPSVAPYTPLAVVFYMLTLLGFVVWYDDGRDRTLFWSGLAAGLCFATKHNVGALALGALALAVLVTATARRVRVAAILRSLSAVGAGFAIVVVAMTAVIAATGGWDGFVEYAFVNKRTYLAVGSARYVRSVTLLIAVLREPFSVQSLTAAYRLLIVALPPVAIVLTVRSLIGGDRAQKIRATGLAIFLLTALASTYPRAGSSMTYVVPVLGAIAGIAWRLGGAPRNRVLRVACITAMAVWLSVALTSMLVNPVRRLGSAEWRLSEIGHCRGILAARERDELLLRQARELRAAVPSGEAFIQTLAAGFYYLATGISNPTPYDMPAVTTFGPGGQQKVIASIATGQLDYVVVFPHLQQPQIPRELMQAIETTMEPQVRSDSFTLFSRSDMKQGSR